MKRSLFFSANKLGRQIYSRSLGVASSLGQLSASFAGLCRLAEQTLLPLSFSFFPPIQTKEKEKEREREKKRHQLGGHKASSAPAPRGSASRVRLET